MRSNIEHKAQGPSSVRCFVLTVSDTRTATSDASGSAIVQLLTSSGHTASGRAIVKDDAPAIRTALEHELAVGSSQVIITTGGTGITSRDSTFEVVNELLDKTLDGFGELFRALSYEQIGSAAIMSRATAGLAKGRILVALPGSESAVRLAMEKLLLPELGHLVQQASK
jgi:molybdenum cofactor biosynthesis protein B